jgi:TonB family protein
MKHFKLLMILFAFVFSACSIIQYNTKEFNGSLILDSSYYDLKHLAEINYSLPPYLNSDSSLVSDFDISKTYCDTSYFSDRVIHGISCNSYFLKDNKFHKDFIRRNVETMEKEFYRNGDLKYIFQNIYHTKYKGWYKNNKLAIIRDHSENQKIDTCFDESGKVISCDGFIVAPSIDIKELQSRLKYPERMRVGGRQARVIIRVFLSKEGKPLKLEFDKGHKKEFLAEAIRVVKETKFSPLVEFGEKNHSWLAIPITFRLR